MTKKRHNISTIAEVLIDKLNDLEKNTKRIERASEKTQNTKLQIDTEELRELLEEQLLHEKSILSDLRALKQKNSVRLPNWVLIVLFAFLLASMSSIFYSLHKAESYEYEKLRADHFEEQYNKLKK